MEVGWKIIYYISVSGENPVSDFLDTLQRQTQSKVIRIFHNIEEYGLQSVIPHLKKLSGTPFWEIRVLGRDSIRVIYVVAVEYQILVLHGFIKKTQKTPLKEIEIARKRYQQTLITKK
ncbi:MAG: type II toxin-antitoxin system RelE/ParE family toxin [Candidatus Daviesbacteria bacterium]|nr:type II toxin-antitoxin system RelE/ParE family toxin [Candidatus Daviesbacteria bacterium]